MDPNAVALQSLLEGARLVAAELPATPENRGTLVALDDALRWQAAAAAIRAAAGGSHPVGLAWEEV